MLSWIPLIGPILQGIFNTVSSVYGKFKDTQLGMRQAEVQEAQIAEQTIAATNDDIALRILRDMAVLPIVAWSMLIGWDTILADTKWGSGYMWHVAQYPPSISYLPYVVLVFLFGNIGLNIWRQK